MRLNTPIYSQSIFLRTLDASDATEAYLGWLSDPTINTYLEVRFSPPRTVRDLAAFIDDTNASLYTLLLGIFLYESGRHIGNIKLGPICWNHKAAEIGFLVGDRKYWGKGYASKAITLLSDYAFEQLGLAKLTAGCYSKNEGSRRALIKANYVEEGVRLSQWQAAGCRQDGILFGRVNPNIILLNDLQRQ